MTDYCIEINNLFAQATALGPQIDAARLDSIERRNLRWRREALYRRAEDLKGAAAAAFAELNGWHRARRSFLIRTLVRGGVHDGRDYWGVDVNSSYHYAMLDHAVYFRERQCPYRSVAIVGQPYNTSLAKAQAFAAEIGLAADAPTDVCQSWHFPGRCRMFCFTRPGTRVHFLHSAFASAKAA